MKEGDQMRTRPPFPNATQPHPLERRLRQPDWGATGGVAGTAGCEVSLLVEGELLA